MQSILKNFFGEEPANQRDRITIGGTSIPSESEPLHFLIAGSTGTGKTTLITEMLCSAIPRGDRIIVCDPAGYHLSRFWKTGDTILNAFDRRSPGWSIFNEVRRDFDYDWLSRSLVPDGLSNDKQWHHYAQVLCSETIRALIVHGMADTAQLMHWLTVAKSEDLGDLLANSPARGLFDRDAAKALASTRFILTAHLNPHKYLQPGKFSLRDWLKNEERGNLFLTWHEDMQTALAPLIGTWIDILCNAILSLPADSNRRIWLILDEVGALGRLNTLEPALTRGRKHGLCVVAGIQS